MNKQIAKSFVLCLAFLSITISSFLIFSQVVFAGQATAECTGAPSVTCTGDNATCTTTDNRGCKCVDKRTGKVVDHQECPGKKPLGIDEVDLPETGGEV